MTPRYLHYTGHDMKFWNKQPKVRERCWYRIDVNVSLNFHQMKRDLQQQQEFNIKVLLRYPIDMIVRYKAMKAGEKYERH